MQKSSSINILGVRRIAVRSSNIKSARVVIILFLTGLDVVADGLR